MRPTVEPQVWMGFLSPPRVTAIAEGWECLREWGQFLANAPRVMDTGRTAWAGCRRRSSAAMAIEAARRSAFAAVIIDLPCQRIAIGLSIVEGGADPAFVDTITSVYGSFRVSN